LLPGHRIIMFLILQWKQLFTRCVVPSSRLGLSGEADTTMEVSLLADTRKKSASLPKHAPPVSTLRHLLTTCLDIREPPKKVCAGKCPYMYIIDVLTARWSYHLKWCLGSTKGAKLRNVIMHNIIQTNKNWLDCVSLATRTCIFWHNMLFYILSENCTSFHVFCW